VNRTLPLGVFYALIGLLLIDLPWSGWGASVPGGLRTEVWDSLWQVDAVARALSELQSPWMAGDLNYPRGGLVWIADPVGSLLAAPLIWLFGLAVAYTALLWGHIVFAGVVAHRFAREWLLHRQQQPGSTHGAWVAGIAFCSTPILLVQVHHGDLSGIGLGWGALASWYAWRAVVGRGRRPFLSLTLAFLLAGLAGWGPVLSAVLFAVALCFRSVWGAPRRCMATTGIGLGVLCVFAWMEMQWIDPMVRAVEAYGLQSAHEVRRAIGSAQLLGFIDPRQGLSSPSGWIRAGEGFVHANYLGWMVLILACTTWFRARRGTGFLWLAVLIGCLFAMGPVWVQGGTPVMLPGERFIPLPYLMVEQVPGFAALRMPIQLVQTAALALALLAGAALDNRSWRWALGAGALLLLEVKQISPVADLPGAISVVPQPAVRALAAAPDGAVTNYPFVPQRAYLYEQAIHRHALAGTLTHVRNRAARTLWKRMNRLAQRDPAGFRTRITSAAKKSGIRYVVLHTDPDASPSMYDAAANAVERAYSPLPLTEVQGDEPNTTRVIPLW